MKVKQGLPPILWILVGLLFVAAMSFSFGAQEEHAVPSATSFAPSGTSILAELLREEGHMVKVEKLRAPALDLNAVYILFVTDQKRPSPSVEKFRTQISNLASRGARVVIFGVPDEFLEASKQLINSPKPVLVINRETKAQLWINTFGIDSPAWSRFTEDSGQSIWHEQSDYASLASLGNGLVAFTPHGILGTNRFIDRNSNAEFCLSIIHAVMRPTDRVLFSEASFGQGEDPDLFAILGPWSVGVWRQLLAMAVLFIVMSGWRFGFPSESRLNQTGGKELVNGLTEVLKRGNQLSTVLELAQLRVGQRLRSNLKLATDASEEELLRKADDLALSTLTDLKSLGQSSGWTPAQVFAAVRNAEVASNGVSSAAEIGPNQKG